MPWKDIETAWHCLVDQIIGQWPEMTAEHLRTVAGDRNAFARYLAATYDLTVNEAGEEIENWMFRRARQNQAEAA